MIRGWECPLSNPGQRLLRRTGSSNEWNDNPEAGWITLGSACSVSLGWVPRRRGPSPRRVAWRHPVLPSTLAVDRRTRPNCYPQTMLSIVDRSPGLVRGSVDGNGTLRQRPRERGREPAEDCFGAVPRPLTYPFLRPGLCPDGGDGQSGFRDLRSGRKSFLHSGEGR